MRAAPPGLDVGTPDLTTRGIPSLLEDFIEKKLVQCELHLRIVLAQNL